jgi:tetratricopeptide (TPR) repeat protein
MIAGDFRVFVSAVTNEFGRVRSAVASDLRSLGMFVKVQGDFRLEADADTLLRKLHNYIRDCSSVVLIIGDRSGARPTQIEAEPFAHLLPSGIKEASYTQWEFFFALHYRRRISPYFAQGYNPDAPPPTTDDPDLQLVYQEHIKGLGIDREYFRTDDELRRKVLKEEWVNARRPKPIVLPYPSIGSLFKGRDEFLQELSKSLKRAGHTAIMNHALYGLGGIGKSRAAVEYAWRHQDEYSALLFVVAETPEALRRNLAALARTLVPKLDTTDDVVRLQAVVDWLKANPGWFLILDNVDSKPALAEVEGLLGGLSGGHVVVTSRLANFSGNFQPLELGVLTTDDAAAFLLARTEGRRRKAADDGAKAREVATELDGLALALEQAAAFIAKRKLTFGQYLEQWRSHRDEVLVWFDSTVTGYPRAVAITWQTSVAQLSEEGRRLLERLAWLAPEKVPESLLDVPIPGAEVENLYDALDDLAAYSLVTRDAEGPFFLVHRLVQDVTRRSVIDRTQNRRLIEALCWIDKAFVGDPEDVRTWPKLDPIAPHARAVVEYADTKAIAGPTFRLMNQLGTLLDTKALYAEAEPLMRRALSIAEKSFEPDHNNISTLLNNLAQLLVSTNRLTESEPLMRQALTISEKTLGPNHPSVAIRLNNLAQLLGATNRRPEAEPLMRRALAIDEKSLGQNHPNVAIRLSNLGSLLYNTNRVAEAEPLIRRALALDEKSLGESHPNVAIRLNNLATLLHTTKRSVEAEPLLRRALTIDEKSFGPNHPTVAIRLKNLAYLLLATERLAEAEPLLRRHIVTLVEFTRRTGHPLPHLEAEFNNYALLLAHMGKSPAEIEAAIDSLRGRDPS